MIDPLTNAFCPRPLVSIITLASWSLNQVFTCGVRVTRHSSACSVRCKQTKQTHKQKIICLLRLKKRPIAHVRYVADSIKVALGIGNWALGSYCLVFTHSQVHHCIIPYARMTNYQSNLFWFSCIWLRGFRDKIANFSRLHRLALHRRDLSTKKTKQSIEIRPEILGVMLEFTYIVERGLFGEKRKLNRIKTQDPNFPNFICFVVTEVCSYMLRVHYYHLLNVSREANWLIYMYTAPYSMSTNLVVCTFMQWC